VMHNIAALPNRAIFFSTVSAIVTCLLAIVAFVTAYLNLRHECSVALLFVVAHSLFTLSQVNLAREILIAPHEYDHFTGS